MKAEDILAEHSPQVRELAERLRQLVLETAPEATEKGYPVWHGIGYRHPKSGYFCGIFPLEDEVRLLFEWGVLLPDPERLLEGSGKQTRHVTIRSEEDIRPAAFRAFIQEALRLPKGRDAKLWLIQSLHDVGEM